MDKKFISYFILICLLLTGCTQAMSEPVTHATETPATLPPEEPEPETEPIPKLTIITTIFAPFDFTRVIAGDKAEISMLLPPGTESHSFEPTPQDIIRIQHCDVFIYAGGESDGWIKRILESMEPTEMKTITLIDCVTLAENTLLEGMESDNHDNHDDHDDETTYDDHDDHDETAYDEHVWTSPLNTIRIVQKITAVLSEADEANADFYQANAAAYIEKLDALDIAFQEVVSSAARRTIVFGDRFPFQYMTEAYGLEAYAAFPGCAAETEPSVRTVAFLIDKIKSENIPVVFHIELSNEKMASILSEETGAKKLLLHSGHNITRDDFLAGVSYLDLMTHNLAALEEALH